MSEVFFAEDKMDNYDMKNCHNHTKDKVGWQVPDSIIDSKRRSQNFSGIWTLYFLCQRNAIFCCQKLSFSLVNLK